MTDSAPFKVQDVRFAYDGRLVLRDVSFVVERGDFVGIIGPNGSGKSTLLKLLLGLLKPSAGSIEVFGKPLDEFREWARIGYVSQRATHFDIGFPATVWEVVSLGRTARAGLFHHLKRQDGKATEEALVAVGMSDMRDRLIGRLSGGQQQRVFIARALAQEPEVLVLDEPTIGVDQEAHKMFFQLMQTLHDNKKLTIIMVSHEVDVVLTEVTKLVCVNQAVLFSGTPKECLQDNCLVKLYGEGFQPVSHAHTWTEQR